MNISPQFVDQFIAAWLYKTEGFSLRFMLIAMLAKTWRVEEKQEMAEKQETNIVRKKNHLKWQSSMVIQSKDFCRRAN